jgi:hypothetical protein
MGSTTTHGLPYPVGTDLIMNGDNAMQALAEAVDTALMADTGTLTAAAGGFTAGAGFTALTGSVRKRSGLVSAQFTLTTSNALAAGDLGNLNCINVPVGWQPVVAAPLTSSGIGPGVWASVYQGFVTISALGTAANAGTQISLNGLWMI